MSESRKIDQADNKADIVKMIVRDIVSNGGKSAAALGNSIYRTLAANGVDVDDLARAVLVEKVRRSRATRAEWQARLDALKARPLVWPTAPTPERRAQATSKAVTVDSIKGAGPVAPVKSHQFEWPIQRAAHLLSDDEYMACWRFREAHAQMQPPSQISKYGDDVGYADPRNKLPLTPIQEQSAQTFNAFWDLMNRWMRAIAWNFVLELPQVGRTRPLTAEEFGRVYGHTKDDRRALGVADGAIKAMATMMAQISKDLDTSRRTRAHDNRARESRRSAAT